MTSLHQHFDDAYAMQHTRTVPSLRLVDPAYRRRQLARRLRPYAQLAALAVLAGLTVFTLWGMLVILAALPIGN
jgi:hypothetical protein